MVVGHPSTWRRGSQDGYVAFAAFNIDTNDGILAPSSGTSVHRRERQRGRLKYAGSAGQRRL
jgi:hypothetical protein